MAVDDPPELAAVPYPCRFFFQAEDGIRDVAVTGVQTCALPILRQRPSRRRIQIHAVPHHRELRANVGPINHFFRSEERRVGKECRSRWSQDDYQKKQFSLRLTLPLTHTIHMETCTNNGLN